MIGCLFDFIKKNISFPAILITCICIYFATTKYLYPMVVKGKPSVADSIIENVEYKVVVIINTDLGMSKGKILSQFGHAIDALHEKLLDNASLAKSWRASGSAKIALKGTQNDMNFVSTEAKKAGMIYVKIYDAGRTQVSPGSFTVMAIGPASKKDLDKITGTLKLY